MAIRVGNMTGGSGSAGGARQKFSTRTVNATTAETAITIAAGKSYMEIENIGTALAYVGQTGVTTTSYGLFLTPKENHSFGTVSSTFNCYVICGSGLTVGIAVIEG